MFYINNVVIFAFECILTRIEYIEYDPYTSVDAFVVYWLFTSSESFWKQKECVICLLYPSLEVERHVLAQSKEKKTAIGDGRSEISCVCVC